MSRRAQRHTPGFTLTELAIVLAVVGVLSAGLYNLLSGANEQVRDQSAASQQGQLIDAAKAFLGSPQGQAYMTANILAVASGGCGTGALPAVNCITGAKISLPLPATNSSVANCMTNYTDANLQQFCTFLPPGFTSGTTNAYSQIFGIQVLRDSTTLPGQAPATYSFMVKTAGGNLIPDTSGGRISSLIGGDGGFVYVNNVCGLPTGNMACGAFGGWSSNAVTGYGFAAASTASGQIASRTYVSPQQNSFFSWLARVPISGDTNFSLNSMTTPEYIGGTAVSSANELDMGAFTAGVMSPFGGGTLNLQSGVINFGYGPDAAGGATTGTMNVQGGTINVGGGTVTNTSSPAVFGNSIPINLQASGPSTPNLINLLIDGTANSGGSPNEGPALNIATGCTGDLVAAFHGLPQVANCIAGIQVIGDGSFAGELTANSLYAQTFIYQASDVRLKTNIQPIADALKDVMRLKPVSFNFKAGGPKALGVLAQDIEKVYPELVILDRHGMRAVNYDGLIAPLIGAVQELKLENDQLRAQLKEQQDRQDKLEKKLNAAP